MAKKLTETEIEIGRSFLKNSWCKYWEPSHRSVWAQNLQTRGLKNGDDVTLVPIFCAGYVGMDQINLFRSKMATKVM